eukprot:SAG31_NODE_806_length_11957_cov_2.232670_2_plen_246_part_00
MLSMLQVIAACSALYTVHLSNYSGLSRCRATVLLALLAVGVVLTSCFFSVAFAKVPHFTWFGPTKMIWSEGKLQDEIREAKEADKMSSRKGRSWRQRHIKLLDRLDKTMPGLLAGVDFDVVDANGDGNISADELADAVRQSQSDAAPHEINGLIIELMDAADADGDGTVNQGEFLELLLRYRPRRRRLCMETALNVVIMVIIFGGAFVLGLGVMKDGLQVEEDLDGNPFSLVTARCGDQLRVDFD